MIKNAVRGAIFLILGATTAHARAHSRVPTEVSRATATAKTPVSFRRFYQSAQCAHLFDPEFSAAVLAGTNPYVKYRPIPRDYGSPLNFSAKRDNLLGDELIDFAPIFRALDTLATPQARATRRRLEKFRALGGTLSFSRTVTTEVMIVDPDVEELLLVAGRLLTRQIETMEKEDPPSEKTTADLSALRAAKDDYLALRQKNWCATHSCFLNFFGAGFMFAEELNRPTITMGVQLRVDGLHHELKHFFYWLRLVREELLPEQRSLLEFAAESDALYAEGARLGLDREATRATLNAAGRRANRRAIWEPAHVYEDERQAVIDQRHMIGDVRRARLGDLIARFEQRSGGLIAATADPSRRADFTLRQRARLEELRRLEAEGAQSFRDEDFVAIMAYPATQAMRIAARQVGALNKKQSLSAEEQSLRRELRQTIETILARCRRWIRVVYRARLQPPRVLEGAPRLVAERDAQIQLAAQLEGRNLLKDMFRYGADRLDAQTEWPEVTAALARIEAGSPND